MNTKQHIVVGSRRQLKARLSKLDQRAYLLQSLNAQCLSSSADMAELKLVQENRKLILKTLYPNG